MQTSEVLQAWATILSGRAPSLSIEITKECPLRCPGCYAFDAAHLGSDTLLRQLSDFKGDELVTRILAILDERKPLHVSLVGGDPFVRYRELEKLIPEIEARGIHTQIVTSAFRVVPAEWRKYKKLNVVVSIDGLQPEHDERRKPATYERILKNILGTQITIHSTITSQIASRPGYLEEFLLERQPRHPQDLVQPLHSTTRRNRPRDPHPRPARPRHERASSPPPPLSQARHARHRHRRDRHPAHQPRGLYLRPYNRNHLRRPQNKDHTMPVRR